MNSKPVKPAGPAQQIPGREKQIGLPVW